MAGARTAARARSSSTTASFDGRGIADELQRLAVQDGRPVAGASASWTRVDVDDAIKAVADSRADCVFFGGTQQAWTMRLLAGLHRALPEDHIYAPAELATDDFAARVPAAVQGSLRLTSPALPTRLHPPAAADFVASYRRTFHEDPAPQAIYGYEAMKLVLVAINNARGKGNDREAVRRQFFRIRAATPCSARTRSTPTATRRSTTTASTRSVPAG